MLLHHHYSLIINIFSYLPHVIFFLCTFFFQNLSNKNWQERRDAVTHVTDHLLQHFDILASAGKIEHCIERILDIFEDGSVKVSIYIICMCAAIK